MEAKTEKVNMSLLLKIFMRELTGVRTKFKKSSFDTESGKYFLSNLRHRSFIDQRKGFTGLINF